MNNILDKVDAASLRDDIPEFRPGDTVNVGAVSYTHLTLPTICSV